ncbi:hypothetical protein FRC12_017987 [Ceratobasidium sp. 428]|nr:hypothetical protein FRC12_017987 [Ceratobasidium sp. 428]
MSFSRTVIGSELQRKSPGDPVPTVLRAFCHDGYGASPEHYPTSAINLDDLLTTEDGKFKWGVPGFGSQVEEARIVNVVGKYTDLHAKYNGSWITVRLDDRIANLRGRLDFSPYLTTYNCQRITCKYALRHLVETSI